MRKLLIMLVFTAMALSANAQTIKIILSDMSGSRLKCLLVSDRGTTDIQIQAGQLAAGVCTYLLIGDGRASDAKQMILTK